jgi:hypothetical protein
MTRGVLLFAHDSGSVKYTDFAAWSAHRIQKYLNVPVSLVTDREIKGKHPFDQIIIADAASNSYRHNFPWRNMGRYQAGELTPYDHTILLDVDYVVNSRQLLTLFNSSEPFISMRWAYDVTGRNDYQTLNYFGRHQMPSAWATVISWQRSQTADLIFGMMKMIETNWQHYLNLYGITDSKFRNDYALAIASNTVFGHTGHWPSIPWSMPNVEDKVKLNQLDNSDFEVKYFDQQTKLRKIILKNMDFHAMDKIQLGAIIGN